jgi:hypothetical protein
MSYILSKAFTQKMGGGVLPNNHFVHSGVIAVHKIGDFKNRKSSRIRSPNQKGPGGVI